MKLLEKCSYMNRSLGNTDKKGSSYSVTNSKGKRYLLCSRTALDAKVLNICFKILNFY